MTLTQLKSSSFSKAAEEIIAAGLFLGAKGWAPATSGNYSMRLEDGRIAITVSGRTKGALTAQSIMIVEADGTPCDNRIPSAETLLHVGIYHVYPDCHAVLHTHSLNSTVFTKRYAELDALVLENYELLKVFPHIKTHEARVSLPIVDNAQDMKALSATITPRLAKDISAYLIRGHGLYAWGRDMTEARAIIEATEFMLGCELELRS